MSNIYIENLGCAKNQVDAEVMGTQLESDGWTWVDDPAAADLIIVNTCGFIEPAQQQSIDTTLALTSSYPGTPVALAGCMAQRFADELAEGLPEIAGIFGNREPQLISEFVRRLERGDSAHGPVVWIPPGNASLTDAARKRFLSHPGSAYLKIAEGCDHACSFCAIPSIRGGLRTRRRSAILGEFLAMRERGVFEFNLIAQDLAAWREPSRPATAAQGEHASSATLGARFPDLIETLLQEAGEFWLRPLYLYPDTFPLRLIDIAASDDRLLPYFDLSFQHAASDVLHRMGRPGNADQYRDLISTIRGRLPDAGLRSSFIVGFPGESEADVETLAEFLTEVSLEWVGVFEYSSQTGTPAASLPGAVPPEEITRRREYIESIQSGIVSERLSRFTGRDLPVLIEERIEGTEIAIGRSMIQAPEVDGVIVVHDTPAEVRPGFRVTATITGVTDVDLQGVFLR